jgi:hypothetical protein
MPQFLPLTQAVFAALYRADANPTVHSDDVIEASLRNYGWAVYRIVSTIPETNEPVIVEGKI